MAQRDGMNLLPENERQAAEAALRRAAQPAKPGEVRLVMPQSTAAKAEPEKKSWWAKRKETRAKKLAAAKADEEARAKVIAQAPKPASKPMPAPLATTKPMVKPAPAPAPIPVAKPVVSVPPVAVAKPAAVNKKSTPKKVAVEVAKPAPKKESQALTPMKASMKSSGGMHEPESTNGFLSPKVNLVPQGVAEQAQGVSWGLYAGVIVVVVGVWVSLSGFAIYRASQAQASIQETNARLDQVRSVIREYETDKNVYLALQKQFVLVKDMIEGHVYWTPFLQKLEETTIPDVYYLGMSANRSGQITLRAVAKSYSAAARQIRAFERSSSFIDTVQVNQVRQELQKGASLPVPVIAFDVQLKLVNGIFTILAPENGAQPIQP